MHGVDAPDGTVIRRPAAGVVRPLEERDVARVAQLHERAMPKAQPVAASALRGYLSRILLHHPWVSESLPSLVYQDDDGEVAGCIGVMARPMLFGTERVTAAISHSFIVAPGSRSTLAAMELAKRFLTGPQDLSLAHGNDVSRRIWESVGGSVSLLYSMGWTRPLRPSSYVLSFLQKRGLSPAIGSGLRPLCRVVDAVAQIARPFRFPEPSVSGVALDARMHGEIVSRFSRDRALRPLYDEDSSGWLFDALTQKRGYGAFQQVEVRNRRQETIGWYLYYLNRGGLGAVVQFGAMEGRAGEVLDHLFHHAWRRGAVAVSGQVDPALFHVLSRKDCLFHHDGHSWFLTHSRHAELLDAIHRGEAFLTRLEGEWWIGLLLS